MKFISKNVLNQKRLLRFFLIFILLVYSVTYSFSQVKDSASVAIHKDTLVKKHSPKKATIMSVCLPGLGQVYNKKYWKVPLMYAGFVALGYMFYQNQTNYINYRDAYIIRIGSDTSKHDKYRNIIGTTDLFNLQQSYGHNRDLSLIGLGLLYMVNIIDASVDAHLFTFDVSDDLSLKIHPDVIYNTSANYYQMRLTVKLNF